MYNVGGFTMREACNDLPTRCTCCDPRRQLILFPDETGVTLKCPATLAAFRAQKNNRILLTGVVVQQGVLG